MRRNFLNRVFGTWQHLANRSVHLAVHLPAPSQHLRSTSPGTRKLTLKSGLMIKMRPDKIQAGIKTCAMVLKLKVAPTAKKNITKKKSRKGFKLSAMYKEMGLDAKATPAIKAPMSSDNPRYCAKQDMPKHHPIDKRKTYSWVLSNFANNLTST